jgi:hypothetical protein
MPGLDDILERLVNDEGFRARLAADPAGALAGYDLSSEDLALLASQVTDGAGASGAVEARTSRASLVGFMSAFGDVAEALSPATADLDVGGTGSPAANAIPTESISMNFEEIKVTYAAEADSAAGDLAATGAPDAQASDEEISLTYRRIEVEHARAGDGDADGADFLVWQRQFGQEAAGAEGTLSATPPDAQAYFRIPMKDALVSGVLGGGSDADARGEEIELQSWAPTTPPAPEPAALATPEGGGEEPTGPIADVLYSAAGNSAPEPPALDPGTAGSDGWVPVVGDWDGDAATADGDSDGRDFLAWQRHFGQNAPDPGSLVLSVGDVGPEPADADATGVLPQPDELGREGTAESEPLAVELENVQITSYQLGVLDNNAAHDLRADDLSPDSPGSESET